MKELAEQLAEAEARVLLLRQQVAAGTCTTVGHAWRHIGGRNAGCDDECCCSIPVHECAKCGECDYGDNDEAAQAKADCPGRSL